MGQGAAGFTLGEAAEWLDPPIGRDQLALLVRALRIKPVGHRPQPGRAHPFAVYDTAELFRLHAAVSPWLLAND